VTVFCAQLAGLRVLLHRSQTVCRQQASLAAQYHLTTTALGKIDTGYLVAYSLGMFASGLLCDRIGPRRLLGFGMIASAVAVATFGFSASKRGSHSPSRPTDGRNRRGGRGPSKQ